MIIISTSAMFAKPTSQDSTLDPVDSVSIRREMEISALKQERLEREVQYYRILVGVVAIAAIVIFVFFYYAKVNRRRFQDMQRERKLTDAKNYISGLENERKRIAKELHDGIANDLLGLEIKLSASTDVRASWIAYDIAKIRNGVRDISHELIPPEFSRLGLDEVLTYYINNVVRRSGIKVNYNTDNTLAVDAIPEHVALEVYRIVQELLSNVLKHSQASCVNIDVKTPESSPSMVQITISDDGPEWTYDTSAYGVGALTTSDRAASIGAKVEYTRLNKLNVKCITFKKHYGC